MYEGHDINFLIYCKKTWLKALKAKTGAHTGPLHQGPWKASYASDLQ